MPKSPNGVYINGSSHHDSNIDIFQRMQAGSHIKSELVSNDNDALGKQFVRSPHAEPYDFQSVLADRVGRQLLGDHVKINPSFDPSPSSSMLNRTNGL